MLADKQSRLSADDNRLTPHSSNGEIPECLLPTLTSRHWVDRMTTKRLFDIGFSLSVLILFSPFYLLIAFVVAIGSQGPVFYVQERVGKHYRRFGCIKFRTMIYDADRILGDLLQASPDLQKEFEASFKLKYDPRITWAGRLLRVTSLDEFPQFWNVLMGDMSVVGPRPLVPGELSRYGDKMAIVLQARPGITGMWQVSGRNDIPYPQRVRMDAYYVANRSFAMDMVIIIRTIGVVIFPKNNGAY